MRDEIIDSARPRRLSRRDRHPATARSRGGPHAALPPEDRSRGLTTRSWPPSSRSTTRNPATRLRVG